MYQGSLWYFESYEDSGEAGAFDAEIDYFYLVNALTGEKLGQGEKIVREKEGPDDPDHFGEDLHRIVWRSSPKLVRRSSCRSSPIVLLQVLSARRTCRRTICSSSVRSSFQRSACS